MVLTLDSVGHALNSHFPSSQFYDDDDEGFDLDDLGGDDDLEEEEREKDEL